MGANPESEGGEQGLSPGLVEAASGGINRLQQLLTQVGNLTGSEAKVMAALLRLRTASLKQIAEATQIVRSNVYPVLDSLSGKGVCRRLPGKYALWECPEPKEVLARLREAEEARLDAARAATRRGFEEAEAMLADVDSTTEESPFAVVADARIALLYQEAINSVDTDLLVLNRGPYVGDSVVDSEVLAAVARGVKARALYVSAELDAPDGQLRMCADAYAAAGVDQRVVDSLPVAMALIGAETALLAVPNRDVSAAVPVHGAAIHHEGIVELLTAAFERIWDQARPYQPTRSTTSIDKRRTEKKGLTR